MEIRWLGQSCFEIKNKVLAVVTDPYSEKIGFKLPKLKANIVTVSHDHYDHDNVDAIEGVSAEKKPFIVNNPGGYEVQGVLIEGISTFHDAQEGKERGLNTVYDIKMDGINICHLGDLGTDLKEEQIEMLDGVDILFIPVGGKYTIDAEHAVKIINKIEPRIIIPMHYSIPGLKEEIDGIDKFTKELGMDAETLDILKLEKKDLPQEGMQLVILNKS